MGSIEKMNCSVTQTKNVCKTESSSECSDVKTCLICLTELEKKLQPSYFLKN
jgi:hypothetical protein